MKLEQKPLSNKVDINKEQEGCHLSYNIVTNMVSNVFLMK